MKEYTIHAEDTNFLRAWMLDDCTICDDIIQFFSHHEKTIGHVVSPSGTVQVDKQCSDSIDCSLDLSTPHGKIYFQKYLKPIVDEYVKIFPMVNAYSRWGVVEPMNIKFYCPGAGYHAYHTERNSSAYPINNRHLVFMTYLNDVHDLGETEFMHQKIKIKPQKGLTVIWPADWTYTHRGIPSPTTEKYIITGWFSFF